MIGSLIKSFLWFSEPFLATILIYILGLTWRIEFKGISLVKKHNSQVLYVFWHENILPPLFTHIGRKVGVIVSPSRDGELISRILKLLGFKVFRGDTKEKGSKALIELINYCKKGFEIAITPDGPKGPRRKAKKGVFLIIKKTNLSVLAVRITCKKAFRFSSWDRFMLPYPFAKIEIELNKLDRNTEKDTLEKLLS